MILFFDTETTGLPDRRFPPAHPSQPHLVQLACLLTEDDGTERASLSVIVRPPVDIPEAASAVHGITNGVAASAGISPAAAVGMWCSLARLADTIVAHNIAFDMGMMEGALARLDRPWPGTQARFCTMRAAAPVVNLPPTERMLAAGFTGPKSPRLEECIRHFFGEDLTGAHDALVDVRACARVFFHLRAMEQAA